jgi:His-Xaa-Ser system radical SAM maturase HxsC
MCSQPPRPQADDWLAQAWLEAIPLMDVTTRELGISGGEPTLLKDDFLNLVSKCAHYLPNTSLHVLTNGRLFNYLSFAERLRDLAHPDLVLGVPLYSDIAWEHDFVVQAEQAFDQTIRGLLNLARCHVRIELRLVIHRYTATTLKSFARFVARNLPFVEHVALMGLEPIGFARSNLAALWIDPADYREELTGAVQHFVEHGMAVSIYNHQLCTLPSDLWTFARRSISDWKNIYLPQCGSCEARGECGGFFHSSAHVYSRIVRPITSPNLSPGV